jgi:hypothetical protein
MKSLFKAFVLLILSLQISAETQYPSLYTDPQKLFKNSMDVTYETVRNVDPALWGVVKEWKSYFEREEVAQNAMVPTFFYFFTVGKNGDVGAQSGLPYFTAFAAKLKKKHPEMKFFGILRGLPEEKQRAYHLFNAEANAGNGTKAGIKIKFLPDMFDELHIDRAPAYAFANCKGALPSQDECDFKYIVRGAVGLDGFLDLMADQNKSYKGWASDAQEAE